MSKEYNAKDSLNIKRSPEVQDIMGQVPSWILRWGISVIGAIIVFLIVGSYYFKYPDKLECNVVVNTINPPVLLPANVSGRVIAMPITDNQYVKKGQLLGVIENTANYKDVFYVERIYKEWNSNLLSTSSFLSKIEKKELNLGDMDPVLVNLKKLLIEYNNFIIRKYFPRKISILSQKRKVRKGVEDIYNRKAFLNGDLDKTNSRIFYRDSILYVNKIKSGEEYDNSRKNYIQNMQQKHASEMDSKNFYLQDIQDAENELDLRHEYDQTKNELCSSVENASKQFYSSLQAWKQKYAVISPINGYVNMTVTRSPNQSIIASSPFVVIIPHNISKSIGLAQLSPSGVGKVKRGQRVLVKFLNYPEEEFGFVEGFVESISSIPDANGNYSAKLSFPHNLVTNYKKRLPQTQQLLGTGEIITRDKRLIENFIAPIQKILKNNL